MVVTVGVRVDARARTWGRPFSGWKRAALGQCGSAPRCRTVRSAGGKKYETGNARRGRGTRDAGLTCGTGSACLMFFFIVVNAGAAVVDSSTFDGTATILTRVAECVLSACMMRWWLASGAVVSDVVARTATRAATRSARDPRRDPLHPRPARYPWPAPTPQRSNAPLPRCRPPRSTLKHP